MAVNGEPVLVGLCGRSGSGKCYVSLIFSSLGIPSIDTDVVYSNLTSGSDTLSPCMSELVERFGPQAANADNSLNRKYMRELVFSDADALKDLNLITHKHILAETEKIVKSLYSGGKRIILIDAPLLYESGFDAMCKKVVAVTAPDSVLIKRITERDGLPPEAAEKRLASQKSISELTARADYVLVNDGTNGAELESEIRKIVSELENAE